MKEDKKKTVVVAAMTYCGKTTLAKSESEYSCIDLDEGVNDKHCGLYIMNRFKSNYGKCDIILMTPSIPALEAIHNMGIDYVTVFPEYTEETKVEWTRRSESRNEDQSWKYRKYALKAMIYQLKNDSHAKAHYTLKPNEYLSDIIDRIYEEQMGSSEETKENNDK